MMNHSFNKLNPELLLKINQILDPHPEAREFVMLYKDYIHAIDDLIDEQTDRDNPETVLRAFRQASLVFNCPFWRKNGVLLHSTELLINNTYADSVQWERSSIKYQKQDSNVLRHAGLDMFFAVILLIAGPDVLRQISSDFRSQCHELHTSETGEAV